MEDPTLLEKEAGYNIEAVNHANEDAETQCKKLILCFDGTNNQFKGDESDTNVVKVFQMLDRSDKHQYHYYQPGIGTYRANSRLQNTPSSSFFAKAYCRARAKADEATANSFADHVMAGYKFLMRYYMEDDKIYVFGFSRGAYTARFLCELINEIGLLSKGNEEMVPFIWYQYIDYRADPSDAARKAKIEQMRLTFCRREIKVFWLGLWDCVSSVAELSNHQAPRINEADPNIAVHVRHAVSCHERRVKFKPTLFIAKPNIRGSFQEMWFAGNHGDVGGGWEPNQDMLLSDIPLLWMIEELKHQEINEQIRLSWRTSSSTKDSLSTYDDRKQHLQLSMKKMQFGELDRPDMLWHDMLDYNRAKPGIKKLAMTPLWWLMECLPLRHTMLKVTRGREWTRVCVQQHGKEQMVMRKAISHEWKTTIRPNLGRHRNIPLDAVFHPSVKQLHDVGAIKSMAKWEYGPVGYKVLVTEETMSHGVPAPSVSHDRYMFIC